MNTILLLIILIPIIEIYLFIKVGSYIGAFSTISLILLTAIIGVIYARYEGFNTLKSGVSQLIKNNFLVGGKINKKPIISVANPGKIKSNAAKARAAPDIIS